VPDDAGEGPDGEPAGEGERPAVRRPVSPTTEAGLPDDRAAARIVVGWQSGAWLAAGVATALLLLGLVRNVSSGLTSIGVGLLLAFALDPVVVRIRRRFHCSRPVAVGVVGAGFVVALGFLVLVLGPPAVEQAGEFGRELPETVEDLYDLPLAGGWLRDADASEKVQEWVDDLPARLDEKTLRDAAERIIGGLLSAVVVALIGIAVLVDGDRLVRRLLAALPDSVEPGAVQAGRIFYRTIGAYFSGSLLVAACAATFILAVGLALGVPLAPAAALWALVVNLIPQIGGFLTGSFFALLGFANGGTTGVLCILLYVLWMNFENHILQPAIVGEAVDLSPPTTMLAALVGGAAAGVPGALVATPLVGAAKAIYLEVRYGTPPEARARRPAPWARWRHRPKDDDEGGEGSEGSEGGGTGD
jgi:predicted PurR-regulated permease PerM